MRIPSALYAEVIFLNKGHPGNSRLRNSIFFFLYITMLLPIILSMETEKTNTTNEFSNLQKRDGIVWVDAPETADTFAYNVTRWESEDQNPQNWRFSVFYKDSVGGKVQEVKVTSLSNEDGFITTDEEPVVLGELIRVELFHNNVLIRTFN